MSHDAVARLGASRYLSLTTFRVDGTPVATPVWVASDGTHLLVTTSGASGKVRRLRRDDRVTVAPCDARGRVLGEAVPGTAEVLDGAGAATVWRAIRAKYGLQARLVTAVERVRRRATGDRVGLRVTLT